MPEKEEFTELSQAHIFNGKKLANFEGPVLIYHAEDDHVVPVSEGKSLYECSKSEKKEICIVELGRHNITTWNKVVYWQRFYAFVDKIFIYVPPVPAEPEEQTPTTKNCSLQ